MTSYRHQRGGEIHLCQVYALAERFTLHRPQSIWHVNRAKRVATVECIVADSGQPLSEQDIRETLASVKRIRTDLLNRGGYLNRLKFVGIRERIATQ